MSKVKVEAAPPAAASAPAAASWAVQKLACWINQESASVTLSVGTDVGGQGFVRAATSALADFEAKFRLAAKALPEQAAAVGARAALVTAQDRRAALSRELTELEQTPLDLTDGQLSEHARREGDVREMVTVLDRRLPGLRDSLASATRALESAAGQLHARMRLLALDETRSRLLQLGGLLAEESVDRFGELVRLESLRQSLAVPFDNVHGETFARDAIAPVPPGGPPPASMTTQNPFETPHPPRIFATFGPAVGPNGIPAGATPPATGTVLKGGTP
jgi:hypothetical protein